MSTVRLYDKDSHIKEFGSQVVSCVAKGEFYETVLAETAFFPEGGGQPADTGRIDDANVLDVQIREGIIYHLTDAPLAVGSEVEGKLDWEQRLRRMQNHSGEHVVSGLVNRLYGYNNVGFHMGKDDVTMDFDGELNLEQLREIELMANRVVAENVRITARYPSPSALKRMKYRSKLDLDSDVRIVTIEGYDKCACCAPHVKRTGQIGMIKLLDFLRYKGGVRIHLQCGLDALDDYNRKYDNISRISCTLSAKQHLTADAVERLVAELSDKKYELAQAKRQIAVMKASQLEPSDANICVFESDMPADGLREIANIGAQICGGVCAVFSGNDENGYNYVIASKDSELSGAAKSINEAVCGRGGGRGTMIQGSAKADRKTIEEFFKNTVIKG
ncbi:MAG: hypothetical protein IJP10_05465 [Clostridia bacterium]|nr:hypothetical protein [Clostridia bacterium]